MMNSNIPIISFRLQLLATVINLVIYTLHLISHLAAVLIDPSGTNFPFLSYDESFNDKATLLLRYNSVK